MLRDKALLNLRAGDILAAAGLHDPAASRYYYALYQAAVHRLGEIGLVPGKVRSGAVEWDHSMVLNNVRFIRRRSADRDLYDQMREIRKAADYGEDPVAPGSVAIWVPSVREFVEETTR